MRIPGIHSTVERLPLRSKLIVLALIPMLAAAVALASLTSSARSDLAEANATSRTATLAIAVGDVLHETQRERGSSAVYLSSSGANFATELPIQHGATDVAVQALNDVLADTRPDLDATIAAELDGIIADLQALHALRGEVLALDAALPPTIATYTAANTALIDVIISIEQQQPAADATRKLLAYRAILQGKEAAGIMRAQFANAFTNDAFGEGQLALLVRLQTRQDGSMAQFADFATPELQEAEQQRLAGPAYQSVADIENTAIANGSGGFGVDPVAWFDVKTTYIDELKGLEDRQAQSVIDRASEAASNASAAFWTLLALTIALAAVVIGVSVAVINTIIDSLKRVTAHAHQIAGGDLQMIDLEIPGNDEIAMLGREFDSMTDTLATLGQQIDSIAAVSLDDSSIEKDLPGELGGKMKRLVEATEERIELAVKEEQHMAETVTLLGEISHRATLLLANSDTLSSVSTELTGGAGETSDQASSVSAASEEASAIAKSVAVALVQLQESVVEISSSATTATATAQRAVAVSDETRETIERLGASSKEIGHVVDLISSIAEDTNVLALNATIEAARAGESGKGFAVVANEVKTLANQTAEATGDIKRRVERIQQDSARAVEAIDGVSSVISEISDSQHSIASAVEEQTATTAEIAAAVEDVAKTSEEIATSITAVADASTRTAVNADRTQEAAGELTELATDLARLSRSGEPAMA